MADIESAEVAKPESLEAAENTSEVFEDFQPCPKEDWLAEKLLAKYAR